MHYLGYPISKIEIWADNDHLGTGNYSVTLFKTEDEKDVIYDYYEFINKTEMNDFLREVF